jgi:hypothetical protein
MAATLVASDFFTFADGNGGHALTSAGAPQVGDIDVLLVGSVTVISSITGSYTLDQSHLDQDAVNGYHRVCSGAEGTALGTVTTSGNFNTLVLWQRWRGLSAYETSQIAVGTGPGISPAAATGTLTEDGELVIGTAFMSQTGVADQVVTSWSGSFTADKSAKLGSTALGVFGASSYKTAGNTTAGATPRVSWSGDATSIATSVVWAFRVAASAGSETGVIAGTFGPATGNLQGTPTPTAVMAGTFRPMTGALLGAVQPLGVLGGNLPAMTGALRSDAAAPDVAVGSWWSLKAVTDERRAYAEYYAAADPVACPHCGEPLEAGPGGELHCRFDGWTRR